MSAREIEERECEGANGNAEEEPRERPPLARAGQPQQVEGEGAGGEDRDVVDRARGAEEQTRRDEGARATLAARGTQSDGHGKAGEGSPEQHGRGRAAKGEAGGNVENRGKVSRRFTDGAPPDKP